MQAGAANTGINSGGRPKEELEANLYVRKDLLCVIPVCCQAIPVSHRADSMRR